LPPPVAEATPIPDSGRSLVLRQLMRPLQPMLQRDDVTEVTINRPNEVWAKTFQGWERFDVQGLTTPALDSLATAMVTFNGMQNRPIVSVVLPDGERGQIVRPPACLDGTVSISIRKHAQAAKTLAELENQGAFASYADVSFNKPSAEEALSATQRTDFGRLEPFEVELLALKRDRKMKEFLEACVLRHRNIVVAGKTGSGKTTLTRSLIQAVPETERLVTIEDVHELMLPDHPNRVHMLYGAGQGRVTADECLASCMRQSPDRIFLAELRGNEAWEYVNSLNTGHPGSITTTHANSAIQTFERIATLIKKSDVGRQLDMDMIKAVLSATVDVILFIHERKLLEVFYDPIFSKSRLA